MIQNMKRMGTEAIKAGKQIQNAGKTITNVGSTLTKSITLPVAAVATAAIKSSNDFGNAMAKVSTIADATQVPMEKLQKQVMGLSNATGVAVSDIGEAQYQAISAGVDTASSVNFVSTAVKAAKGGFTDTTTAVNGLTTVLNAYKMKSKEATAVSDQMLVAQNFGKTSFGEMASSMGNVIPIASSLDVSTQELFSSIAVLTKNGIATSESITGLKAAYSNILKPSSDAAKYADEIGLKFDGAHLKSVGWAKMLEEIKEKTKGDTEAMGRLFGSTEALNSVLVLAGKGSKDFSTALSMMDDSTGATQKAYEKMLTPTERMNIAINKVKNSLIQFGTALTPVFNKAADVIGKIGDRLNSLSEGQVKTIIKFAAIAAAIGSSIMIFGKLVTTIGTVKRTIGTITKTIANFGGIMGAITSPAGIVIGVLAGIALAAVLVIKNWNKVKDVLSNVGKWFTDAFEKAGVSVKVFQKKFSSIKATLGEIAGKITGFLKLMTKGFQNEFAGSVKKGVPIFNQGLQGAVKGAVLAFEGIATAVDKGLQVFNALIDFFGGSFMGKWNQSCVELKRTIMQIFPKNIADGLIKSFETALPVIKAIIGAIKKTFQALVQDIRKIVQSVKNVIKGIGTFFKGVFSGDATMALGGFKNACNGILDTIKNLFQAKIRAIKNLVVNTLSNFLPESVVNKIKFVFDSSIQRWDVAIGIGKGLIKGFVQSIKPIIENVKTIFHGLSQFVSGVFTGDWKKALNGLKSVAKGAFSVLLNIIKAPFTMIKNIIKGAIQGFKSLSIVKTIVKSVGNTIKNILEKNGVDFKKLSTTIVAIKTKIGSILNNIKTIFSAVFGVIGKIIKTVAIVFASVFGKKISHTCSVVKTVILALQAGIGAAFKLIVSTIKIAMSVIVPVIKVAFSGIKGVISAAVQNISNIIKGFLTVLDGITTFISGVFTGNWSKAWNGIKTIFKGAFESLVGLCKTPINAVIGLINGAINGINKLGVSIPDWVPGVGGKEFKINIPTIPMLYKGTNNWKGGTAMIHDKGAEIVDLPSGSRVYPHDKSLRMAREEGRKEGNGITIQIAKLADEIIVREDSDINRIADAAANKIVKKLLEVRNNMGGIEIADMA